MPRRTKLSWADLEPRATDDEAMRWGNPRLVALARRRAAIDARKAHGPAARLAALAMRDVGASDVFPKYRSTPQLSGAIRETALRTGAEFASAVERDLVTGEPAGVRVTLAKRATRGKAPAGADVAPRESKGDKFL